MNYVIAPTEIARRLSGVNQWQLVEKYLWSRNTVTDLLVYEGMIYIKTSELLGIWLEGNGGKL